MEFQVISFHCILKNKLGRVLSSTINNEVLTFDTTGRQPMLKGLAEGLQNLKPGERRKITLPANEAYGYYDTSKVIEKTRDDFPENQVLRVGDHLVLPRPDGKKDLFRITKLTAETVYLDANHPLAGQDLVFEIEALTVRKATPEEIFESDSAAERPLLH